MTTWTVPLQMQTVFESSAKSPRFTYSEYTEGKNRISAFRTATNLRTLKKSTSDLFAVSEGGQQQASSTLRCVKLIDHLLWRYIFKHSATKWKSEYCSTNASTLFDQTHLEGGLRDSRKALELYRRTMLPRLVSARMASKKNAFIAIRLRAELNT